MVVVSQEKSLLKILLYSRIFYTRLLYRYPTANLQRHRKQQRWIVIMHIVISYNFTVLSNVIRNLLHFPSPLRYTIKSKPRSVVCKNNNIRTTVYLIEFGRLEKYIQ